MTAEERALRVVARAAGKVLDSIGEEAVARSHVQRVGNPATGGPHFLTHARISDLDLAIKAWRKLAEVTPA